MDENTQAQNRIGSCMGAIFALIFLGAGLVIILASLNIIKTPEESFNAPRLIILAAGMVFFLAGLTISLGVIFSQVELRLPVMLWIQYLISLAIMISFCTPFLWAGFGPGEREFQTSAMIGPIATSGRGNEGFGRILFGGVGLLCSLGTAFYAIKQPGRIIRGEFKSLFEQNRQDGS
jgi:Ca2+/Na+ antiporter